MISLRQLQDVTRADCLSSVGLYFMNDRIIMVRLRKSFLTVAMVEAEERELPQGDNRQAISELTGWVAEDVKEIALKAESDARERSLRQALVSLLPHFNALRDAVYICVPPDQVERFEPISQGMAGGCPQLTQAMLRALGEALEALAGDLH